MLGCDTHGRKLSLGTGLKVSRDIEEERREQCVKVDWPHFLMYPLRCALLHGGVFSQIKLKRQIFHPRLGISRGLCLSCVG